MNNSMFAEQVSERFWYERQSWCAERVERWGGTPMRATVRRNAYDDQSTATVERWDGQTWQRVLTRSIQETPAAPITYVWKPGELHSAETGKVDPEGTLTVESLLTLTLDALFDAAETLLGY